jgi:glycosyltransferase involved in cell wall biosynthesis
VFQNHRDNLAQAPQRPRLLEVINSSVDKHGSFEDFFLHLGHGARKRGWDLTFVFPRVETPEVRKRLEAGGATVHTLDGRWASMAGALALIRLIARLRPDVVNFHFCGTLHYILVFAFCILTRRRVVFHYHGEIRPIEKLRWRNRHLSALRLASFFWTKVVTVSHANRRYLEALHVAAPISVIYNGIDAEMYVERARAASGQPVRDRTSFELCYMGSLIPRKRVDVLLRAFAQVAARYPAARLTIIGGGYLAAEHQRLCAELKLEERVVFTGTISAYPFDRLAASDLLVSASESESFGLVFCEAMCLGVPVVACRVGGIPEVVQDGVTGLLAPPNDPEAFAAAVSKLIGDPELRRRMSEAGRKLIPERFGLPDKIDALYDLFEKTF